MFLSPNCDVQTEQSIYQVFTSSFFQSYSAVVNVRFWNLELLYLIKYAIRNIIASKIKRDWNHFHYALTLVSDIWQNVSKTITLKFLKTIWVIKIISNKVQSELFSYQIYQYVSRTISSAFKEGCQSVKIINCMISLIQYCNRNSSFLWRPMRIKN